MFVIVLENENEKTTYDPNGAAPYLANTLTAQGTLLSNYYATAHLSNPNYIAMISGQGPNPVNQGDCLGYIDFQPSPAVFGPDGQAVGQGCVYPPNVTTRSKPSSRARRTTASMSRCSSAPNAERPSLWPCPRKSNP